MLYEKRSNIPVVFPLQFRQKKSVAPSTECDKYVQRGGVIVKKFHIDGDRTPFTDILNGIFQQIHFENG